MAPGCFLNGLHMKEACGVLSSPITHTHTDKDGYGVRSPSAYWVWQITPQVVERETDFAWHLMQFLRGWSNHHNPLHPTPPLLQLRSSSSPTPPTSQTSNQPPMHQQTSPPSDFSPFKCNGLQPVATTLPRSDLMQETEASSFTIFTIRDSWHICLLCGD